MDTKRKLTRLKSITPRSVAVDISSIPTQTMTIPTSPPIQTSNITENSHMLARQINFDRFEEVGEMKRGASSVGIENEENIAF